jgi:hypothetical protein
VSLNGVSTSHFAPRRISVGRISRGSQVLHPRHEARSIPSRTLRPVASLLATACAALSIAYLSRMTHWTAVDYVRHNFDLLVTNSLPVVPKLSMSGIRMPRQSPAKCPSGRWGVPRKVGLPRLVVARWPSLTEMRGRLILAGMNTQQLSDAQRGIGMVLWESAGQDQGREVPGPDWQPGHAFVLPRVVLDGLGRIHLFWGEADTTGSPTIGDAIEQQHALWWSMSSRSGTWTRPKRLLSGLDVDWRLARVLRGNDQRSIFIVVTSRDSTDPTGVSYLHFNGANWEHRRVPRTLGGVYPSVAQDSSGRLFLVFVAGATGTKYDANSVFVTRSNDTGRTWSDVKLLSRSGSLQAFNPSIVWTPSALHVVWAQDRTGNQTPDAVREIHSLDRGAHWSVPNDLKAPPGFSRLSVAADRCGGIHVVFEDWGGAIPGHLDYAHLGPTWSSVSHLFSQMLAMDPTLTLDEGGALNLTFSGSLSPDNRLMSLVSTLPVGRKLGISEQGRK